MIKLNFPNPVKSEDGFFDRRREWADIERRFRAGGSTPVVILGERRIGKTSLQLVATKRLERDESLNLEPLSLPFGELIHSTDDFAREILHALCIRIGVNIRETGLFTTDEGFRLDSFGEYTQVLRDVMNYAGERDFLICVDEFDMTAQNCEKKGDERLVALVTHLVEKTDLPIRFFFSMTGLPETIKKSFGSPFEMDMVELEPFSYDDMEEMVLVLLTPDAQVSEIAIKQLFSLSGGHPYITKLFLESLLAPHGFEAKGLVVDEVAVEQAVAEAVDGPQARGALANLYDMHFNDEEKGLMLLLTQRQAQGQTGVTKQELKVCGPDYITAAEALLRRDYLYKIPGEQGREGDQYCLRIAFLGRWLRRWERYESEVERRLKDVRRRLRRMEKPWEGVEPTVVTEEDLRKLGLRP